MLRQLIPTSRRIACQPRLAFKNSTRNPTTFRAFSTTPTPTPQEPPKREAPADGISPAHREAAGLPDFVESWDAATFYKVGSAGSIGLLATFVIMGPTSVLPWIFSVPLAGYWYAGLQDITQTQHTIRRNFPVLGRVRYLLETFRPEIRQYFIESDLESMPFSRDQRSIVYQRAKGATDTQAFGTRHSVYEEGYEWINHSMYPTVVPEENKRIMIGGPGCKQPYSASLLNVSGMSYGAISDNAVLALNAGAKLGNFYQNTGEGGISKSHLKNGGDIVWNVGTGYFGCRKPDGTFCEEAFKQNAVRPEVKMIEIKLSQGAKPAHGGMLPGAKVTEAIAAARGVAPGETCHSPPSHSAFRGPREMLHFVDRLKELSGGKPVGFKLCVGRPRELAAVIGAMRELDITPDFITVDGGEGGTGAAPKEFTNRVGFPLWDGLHVVHQMLVGAGLRKRVTVIASGKIISGYSIVRALAMGADLCNSARSMMFALGCIQALRCNTNKCPTGIATQDQKLMAGLDVDSKSVRVWRYQQTTVKTALELIGAAGLDAPHKLKPGHIMRRTSGGEQMRSLSELHPNVKPDDLIRTQQVPISELKADNSPYYRLHAAWNLGQKDLKNSPY